MLHKFRFVIMGGLMVFASAAASYAAVSAAMPSALLPAGSTRYATAQSQTLAFVDPDQGFLDVPGMTKFITIPSGQQGDVMIIYCAEVASSTAPSYYLRAIVGGVLASPGDVQIQLQNSGEQHVRHLLPSKRECRQPGHQDPMGPRGRQDRGLSSQHACDRQHSLGTQSAALRTGRMCAQGFEPLVRGLVDFGTTEAVGRSAGHSASCLPPRAVLRSR